MIHRVCLVDCTLNCFKVFIFLVNNVKYLTGFIMHQDSCFLSIFRIHLTNCYLSIEIEINFTSLSLLRNEFTKKSALAEETLRLWLSWCALAKEGGLLSEKSCLDLFYSWSLALGSLSLRYDFAEECHRVINVITKRFASQ